MSSRTRAAVPKTLQITIRAVRPAAMVSLGSIRMRKYKLSNRGNEEDDACCGRYEK